MKKKLLRTFTLLLCTVSLSTIGNSSPSLWQGPNYGDMQQLTTDLIQYNEDTLAHANSNCASIAFPKLARSIFIQHRNIKALLSPQEQSCPAWNNELKRDENSLRSVNDLTFYAFLIINYPDSKLQLLTLTQPLYQDPIISIAGMPSENSGWIFTPYSSDTSVVITH